MLITGEAGIGNTRLLDESRAVAVGLGMLALKGRAVESGGAYRPLVEAFAWPVTRFADEPTVAGIRPILARVLPGWAADESSFVPMADPAAVLAEALVVLLEAMAPSGAVVTFDDLHWADPDTLSVLDLVDQLPVALVVAARDDTAVSTSPRVPSSCSHAHRQLPALAHDVLIQRIETLRLVTSQNW